MSFTREDLAHAFSKAEDNFFRVKDFSEALALGPETFHSLKGVNLAISMLEGKRTMVPPWNNFKCIAYIIAYIESEAFNFYQNHRGKGDSYLQAFEKMSHEESLCQAIRSLVIKYSNYSEASDYHLIFVEAIKGILTTSHTSKLSGENLYGQANRIIERLFSKKYNKVEDDVESSVAKTETDKPQIDAAKDETSDVSIPPEIKVR